jgi:threonyl-tRNA synthetase
VLDDSNETLSYRIRHAEILKTPYVAVIGQREADAGTIAVRVRGAGNKQEIVTVEAFTARVLEEVRTRALTP